MSKLEQALLVEDDMCPDGRCQKRIFGKKDSGLTNERGEKICGGKIIRVIVSTYMDDSKTIIKQHEEIECTKCGKTKKSRNLGQIEIKKNKFVRFPDQNKYWSRFDSLFAKPYVESDSPYGE